MFPDFIDDDIVSHAVHREAYVQPIHEIGYSEKIPPMKTPMQNFYIANSTMIVNSTLNNNEVIKIARKAADIVGRND